MSQLSQHHDGPDAHPRDSPAVNHTYAYHHHHHHQQQHQHYLPPNNPSSSSDTAKRSTRKAPAPSPLQTSITPEITTPAASPPSSATPTGTSFSTSGGHSSFPTISSGHHSSVPEPRSPKERLDDLLASEQSYYNRPEAEASTLNSTSTSTLQTIPEGNNSRYTTTLRDNTTNGPSRSLSNPVSSTSQPVGGSPTSSQAPMAAPNPAQRVDVARQAPRTSSIDSAISSLSSGTHSKKNSQDMAGGAPDIANLIQAAGSPEAVIQYLLKEKQSQASQNAQLWRLVDKQRAMILGLNKDLERALRDKERYRKKLKESLAAISNPSPVDSNRGAGEGSTASDPKRPESPRSANVEAIVSGGFRADADQPPSPINVALAPYPITPPPPQTPGLGNMVEAEHKMPSPTQHAFQQYNPDAPGPGFEAGQQLRKANEVAREIPYNAALPPSRTLSSDAPRGPPPSIPPPRAPISSQKPSLSVVEPSPTPDDGLRTFPQPPRKAPPAPLNLGKKTVAPSSHLRQASGTAEETDSDYDDILEVDELPTFSERGRRKTREEDDREREYAAVKAAEERSLSKKSAKSSKSRPTTPKDSVPGGTVEPMPISPRAVQISPPDAHLRHLSPSDSTSGSLAGILNDASGSGIISPPLLSPGLPLSPRPMDRAMNSPLPRNPTSTVNSPPMSPRGMGGFLGAVPLSPRAPRQPIPLPPNTPMSLTSPGMPKGEPLQLVSPKPLNLGKSHAIAEDSPTQDSSPDFANSIYRGLVTEEYPELLLPPNALPSIDVRVASSRLKPSRSSIMFPKNIEEDPVFTLAVFARSDGRELWRVEKEAQSVAQLDAFLKQSASFTAKTPERSLFSGHAPAKVDARRAALDKYLDEVLNTQLDIASALEICRYLSTNTMEPYAEDVHPAQAREMAESPTKTGPGGRPLKNGYLTKRGKNFGGWKARYFVLDGPVFKYYESPGGPHLGAIKLQSAQIGKQQQQADNDSPSRGDADDVDNQYRHAFLILEPKRKDSSSLVRHVLCAESDVERDQWVEALLQYVDYKDSEEDDQPPQHARHGSSGSGHASSGKSRRKYTGPGRSQGLPDLVDDGLRGVSYDSTKQGSIPVGAHSSKNSGTPSPPTYGNERDPLISHQASKSISAPKNAHVIQDTSQWGNRQNMLAPVPDDKKTRKRSFFGFGTKPVVRADAAIDSNTSLSQLAYDQHGPIRPAFGATLSEAVRYNHPVDVQIELPAVVYRCIEYLDAKNAAGEEGIFRLSGSNVVIKQLRERFNVEGDVNLVTDDQYYDIHAVASLLKLYLRELPSTILTRELHLEFLAVTELHDVGEKVSALNKLVHRLPRANHTLLRYLSGFLINIINHADTNKMTVRNVGIVFSPTLNIPAPVFALFLQQYDDIFGEEPDHNGVEVTVTAPPLSPEDIRSPRRQKFQDLPTPSYDQQSFPQQPPPAFPPPQHYQQSRAFDTGFSPMQPTYEQHLMAGPEYGRGTPTLAGPAYDQYTGGTPTYRQYGSETQSAQSKNKNRQSTMFGMNIGLGQRKPSNQRLKDNDRLVDEETFFD